jgi:peptidylprolyl isomerase
MKHLLLAAAAASLALPVIAQEPAPIPSPGEIAATAPASDWIAIAPSDLLVIDLEPDTKGKARRVVIQLMPAPFSQGWIANIRKLAAAHWWDGTSINRVQDNYVVQWGDATEKKALPEGLATVAESEYVTPLREDLQAALRAKMKSEEAELLAAFRQPADKKIPAIKRAIPRDPFAEETIAFRGWPVAIDRQDQSGWPVHCYGMVGVGRNLSPDTGSGAELYTVIGHAPRHLDQNIALVGRVVSGIEHLSSLPRGTGTLGFYETEAERVPIASIRIASELPAADQPRFEYLSTESDSFARYADARANRRDPFFIKPAGGADICNIPVPVRAVAK